MDPTLEAYMLQKDNDSDEVGTYLVNMYLHYLLVYNENNFSKMTFNKIKVKC